MVSMSRRILELTEEIPIFNPRNDKGKESFHRGLCTKSMSSIEDKWDREQPSDIIMFLAGTPLVAVLQVFEHNEAVDSPLHFTNTLTELKPE